MQLIKPKKQKGRNKISILSKSNNQMKKLSKKCKKKNNKNKLNLRK